MAALIDCPAWWKSHLLQASACEGPGTLWAPLLEIFLSHHIFSGSAAAQEGKVFLQSPTPRCAGGVVECQLWEQLGVAPCNIGSPRIIEWGTHGRRRPSLLYLPEKGPSYCSGYSLNVFGYLTLEARMRKAKGSIHMEEFASADCFCPIVRKRKTRNVKRERKYKGKKSHMYWEATCAQEFKVTLHWSAGPSQGNVAVYSTCVPK